MEPEKYSFDKLQMFFGEDYQVAEGIIISQPTIGEIMTFGEDKFNQVLNPFVVNPTSLRVALWQQGKDWTEMSDYELFYQLILQIKPTPDETYMIFGDLDFSIVKSYKIMKAKTKFKLGVATAVGGVLAGLTIHKALDSLVNDSLSKDGIQAPKTKIMSKKNTIQALLTL